MRLVTFSASFAFVLASHAHATVWPAKGDDLAGGTFTVEFFTPPPGSALTIFTTGIVAGAGETGTAEIVPDPVGNPQNKVILTVTGDTWTATWRIDNRIQTLDRVIIDLGGSPSVFDDGTLPSTPGSSLGRPYSFVSLTGGGGDPVLAPLWGGAGPGKNVGDLHDELTLVFTPGGFNAMLELSFQADTDKFVPPGSPLTCDTTEPIGQPFCDGGTLGLCPCGNPGAPDTGCEIAQGTGGVRLCAVAQESTPMNRGTLVGSGFPPAASPTAIVIRSNGLDPNDPTTWTFGDGLLCIDATAQLVRLAATIASGGTTQHEIQHGAMVGSGTFYYQIWFRNTPAMYCTPDAFNLSGGRSLTW